MKFIRTVPFLLGISYLAMALTVLVRYTHLPPQIPLYYSLPVSGSHIVNIWYITLLPVISGIFLAINAWGVKRLVRDDEFGQTLIYIAQCVVIAATTYLFIRIILLIS